MKPSIYSTLFLLFTVLLFSCKDDESETGASIIGKWKGDRSEVKLTYGVITLREETDEDFNVLLEFNGDGTVKFTRDGTVSTGTYSLNGNKLSTNVDFQIEELDLSDVTFDVIELSETKLRLDMERDQDVMVPDLGEVTTTVKGNFDFDRL